MASNRKFTSCTQYWPVHIRNLKKMNPPFPSVATPADLESKANLFNQFLSETSHSHSAWSGQDYGPIMLHQLAAPLGPDLALLIAHAEETLSGVSIRTFGDLLLHPSPPVPALTLVKDFAKQLSENARFAYPRPVATMLYYASICAAWLHARTKITHLSETEIRKGVRWALKQTWLPEPLRPLFAESWETTPRQS